MRRTVRNYEADRAELVPGALLVLPHLRHDKDHASALAHSTGAAATGRDDRTTGGISARTLKRDVRADARSRARSQLASRHPLGARLHRQSWRPEQGGRPLFATLESAYSQGDSRGHYALTNGGTG